MGAELWCRHTVRDPRLSGVMCADQEWWAIKVLVLMLKVEGGEVAPWPKAHAKYRSLWQVVPSFPSTFQQLDWGPRFR